MPKIIKILSVEVFKQGARLTNAGTGTYMAHFYVPVRPIALQGAFY